MDGIEGSKGEGLQGKGEGLQGSAVGLDGMRALVLGGTGLIGSHVVSALLRRRCAVRVMTRRADRDPMAVPALRGMDVELVPGGLSEPASIRRALDGCDLLFHAAAPYPTRHLGMGRFVRRAETDLEALLAICRELTDPALLRFDAARSVTEAIEQADMAARVARAQPERRDEIRSAVRDSGLVPLAESGMLNASLHPPLGDTRALPGLKRIVYTSSVTTVGRPRGREPGLDPHRKATEADRYSGPRDPSPYFRCKRLMEAAVVRAANEGLPVVIVNPTLVVGARDAHLTTGRLITAVARGDMPFYLAGKLNAIAAEDVGEGEALAAERGRTGQRYILGNETMSVRAFLTLIAEEAGTRAPWIPMPYAIAEPASLLTEIGAWITGARWPALPTHSLRMVRCTPEVDPSLAFTELGVPRTPIPDAVRQAIRWYRAEGMI